MKKILLIISCLVLCFALTSCDITGDILGNQNGTGESEGKPGKDGKDGSTPYIKNGYWYIDRTNTYVKAEGTNGVTPTIEVSADGYWILNGVKTEHKAIGVDGTNGTNGEKGDTGVGIEKVELDNDGNLLITYTDGTTQTVVLPADSEIHEHTYGEWVSYGGSTEMLYTVCKTCKEIIWKFGTCSTHTFTTTTIAPTCVAEGYDENTCSVCGFVEKTNYTAISGHSYKETYSYNNSFHWLDCEHCDATANYGEHNIDDSGYCTVCDQPVGSTEGILYELSADGTYAEVIGYNGTATKIVIADTYNGVPVIKIYREAFKSNTTIKSIVIPDSVTIIGQRAFYECSRLTSVTISDSVKRIGERAFYYCYDLESVTIGNGVTAIDSSAFYFCTSLTSITIPDSVTSIGNSAFSFCSSLTSITIPDSVTSIGNSAFSYCNSAMYTEYEFGRYVRSGDNPYAVLIELTNKNLSTYTINENTKIIANRVFESCERLTNITIPNSVTSIGSYAFSYCDSLTSITIGNGVTSIGDSAFYYCESLTSITISDSVTSIGSYAFNSSGLQNVYYTGSEEKWKNILIETGNHSLTAATIHYNYSKE